MKLEFSGGEATKLAGGTTILVCIYLLFSPLVACWEVCESRNLANTQKR
jgi:hypothetical protein